MVCSNSKAQIIQQQFHVTHYFLKKSLSFRIGLILVTYNMKVVYLFSFTQYIKNINKTVISKNTNIIHNSNDLNFVVR